MTTGTQYSPQETRRQIITSMKPGREYTASDIARLVPNSTQRAITRNMGALTKMGLVVGDRILLSGGPVTAWRLNMVAGASA